MAAAVDLGAVIKRNSPLLSLNQIIELECNVGMSMYGILNSIKKSIMKYCGGSSTCRWNRCGGGGCNYEGGRIGVAVVKV